MHSKTWSVSLIFGNGDNCKWTTAVHSGAPFWHFITNLTYFILWHSYSTVLSSYQTYCDRSAIKCLGVKLFANGISEGFAHSAGHVDGVYPLLSVSSVLHREFHLRVHLSLGLLHIWNAKRYPWAIASPRIVLSARYIILWAPTGARSSPKQIIQRHELFITQSHTNKMQRNAKCHWSFLAYILLREVLKQF